MSGYVHPPQLDIRLSAAYDDKEERPFAVAVKSVGFFGLWPKNTDFAALGRGIEDVVARHTTKRGPAVDACGLVDCCELPNKRILCRPRSPANPVAPPVADSCHEVRILCEKCGKATPWVATLAAAMHLWNKSVAREEGPT